MRLTTKGRYAVTAMLDLAMHTQKGPVTLADISERQGISLSYLEQLFAKLRRKKLVRSVRGPGGGYLPGHRPERINVAQIIDAVNESVNATRCGGTGDCQEGHMCLTHRLWDELSERIHDFLSNISLAKLIQDHAILAVAERQNQRQQPNRIPLQEEPEIRLS